MDERIRVRVCIAVNDNDREAAAVGWDASRFEADSSWDLMEQAKKQHEEAGGSEPTRFVWAEVDLPEPGSPEELEVVEVHRARQGGGDG